MSSSLPPTNPSPDPLCLPRPPSLLPGRRDRSKQNRPQPLRPGLTRDGRGMTRVPENSSNTDWVPVEGASPGQAVRSGYWDEDPLTTGPGAVVVREHHRTGVGPGGEGGTCPLLQLRVPSTRAKTDEPRTTRSGSDRSVSEPGTQPERNKSGTPLRPVSQGNKNKSHSGPGPGGAYKGTRGRTTLHPVPQHGVTRCRVQHRGRQKDVSLGVVEVDPRPKRGQVPSHFLRVRQ